jgi:predicted ATP-dependent Lon-type protease
MGCRTVGLVGLWDVVAFDEVAGVHSTDKEGVQIMKDFMASNGFKFHVEDLAVFVSLVRDSVVATEVGHRIEVLLPDDAGPNSLVKSTLITSTRPLRSSQRSSWRLSFGY